MSDSDEPAWVTEQTSAQKLRLADSRLSNSSDISINIAASDDGGSEQGDAPKATGKEKHKAGRAPPSSRLPLVLAGKVRRDTLLLEMQDPTLDLSGDFGCIGRLHVKKAGAAAAAKKAARDSEGAGSSADDGAAMGAAEQRQTVMLDLKGKLYDGNIVPCNTLCVLAIDGSKARVDAVFGDFVQLQPPRDSIFDSEAVQVGEMGADFFDDGEDNFNVNEDYDSDAELGPLKEGKAKSKAKPKSKPKPRGKGAKGGAGAKRKGGAAAGPNKKAKA